MWFAFIFVSLQSLRQQLPWRKKHRPSCDLLLFSYLCKVLDNRCIRTCTRYELWFAFIFVSLQSLRQQFFYCFFNLFSCDLLLFSYLCKVLDNVRDDKRRSVELWFAFIFVSLQSLRQHELEIEGKYCCCDLLLFSYLCKVLDNVVLTKVPTVVVVICFYFRIFAKS